MSYRQLPTASRRIGFEIETPSEFGRDRAAAHERLDRDCRLGRPFADYVDDRLRDPTLPADVPHENLGRFAVCQWLTGRGSPRSASA